MKRLGPIFFLFMVLTACHREKVQIPDNVLNESRMAAVLADLQLAESTLSQSAVDSLDIWRNKVNRSVFLKHGITQAEFDSSFRFYQRHMKLMGGIMDQVIIILSQQQTVLEGERTALQQEEDTLAYQ